MICAGYGGGVLMFSTTEAGATATTTKSAGFGAINGTLDLQWNLSAHILLSARLGGAIATGDVTAETAAGNRIFKSSLLSGYTVGGIGVRF